MLREELERESVSKEKCLSLYRYYLIKVFKYGGDYEKVRGYVLSIILHDRYSMTWSDIEKYHLKCAEEFYNSQNNKSVA